MKRGDRVIEISTGNQYIVFDEVGEEICILQFFPYAEYPFNRQLTIWSSKNNFVLKPRLIYPIKETGE